MRIFNKLFCQSCKDGYCVEHGTYKSRAQRKSTERRNSRKENCLFCQDGLDCPDHTKREGKSVEAKALYKEIDKEKSLLNKTSKAIKANKKFIKEERREQSALDSGRNMLENVTRQSMKAEELLADLEDKREKAEELTDQKKGKAIDFASMSREDRRSYVSQKDAAKAKPQETQSKPSALYSSEDLMAQMMAELEAKQKQLIAETKAEAKAEADAILAEAQAQAAAMLKAAAEVSNPASPQPLPQEELVKKLVKPTKAKEVAKQTEGEIPAPPSRSKTNKVSEETLLQNLLKCESLMVEAFLQMKDSESLKRFYDQGLEYAELVKKVADDGNFRPALYSIYKTEATKSFGQEEDPYEFDVPGDEDMSWLNEV